MNDERAEQAAYEDDAPSLFSPSHEDTAPPPGPPRSRRWASCLIVLLVLGLLACGAYALVSVGMDKAGELFQGPEDYSG